MDVHPPEAPIRSVLDFGLHILTVTIGILIALGLDALVTEYREMELANHARADFRDEIGRNRDKLVADQKSLAEVQGQIEGLIAYEQAKLADKPANLPTIPQVKDV